MKNWLSNAAFSIVGIAVGFSLQTVQLDETQVQYASDLAESEAAGNDQFQQSSKINSVAFTNAAHADVVDQLAGVNPAFYKQVSDKYQTEMLYAMFKKAAYTNPSYAAQLFEEIRERDTRYRFMAILLTAWGEIDPKAAYVWYSAKTDDCATQLYDLYVTSVLSPLAHRDPEFTWSIIDSLKTVGQKDLIMQEITTGWIEKDHAAAFEWLSSLWDSRSAPSATLKKCYEEALVKYSKVDPVSAAETVKEIEPGKLQQTLVRYAVRALAEHDLGQAMDWTLQLQDNKARHEGIYQIVDSYADEQPDLVLDYVQSNTDASPRNFKQIGEAFSNASQLNPGVVAKRFHEVPENVRVNVAANLTRNWIYADESKAVEWLSSQPEGPVRDAGSKQVAKYFKGKNIDTAFKWALSISDKSLRTQVVDELNEFADWN